MSPENGKPSLFRRIGKKGLRFLRPVTSPIFNRLQLRFQAAVEQSSLPQRLADMAGAQQSLAASLASAIDNARTAAAGDMASLVHRLAAIESGQQAAAAQLAGAIEGVRSAHAGATAALVERLEGMQVGMQRLQVGLDAVRLDVADFMAAAAAETRRRQEAEAASAAAAAAWAGAAATASQQLAQRLDALSQRAAADAQLQRDAAAGTAAAMAAAAEAAGQVAALAADAKSEAAAAASASAVASQQMMARLDLLVRRSALTIGGDALLQTPAGFLLVPAEDRTLLAAVWESGGRLEPGTVQVMTALLREGDHVVDVGAHIGLTVLPAARKVGASGRVAAFEPAARVANLLRQSLALNFVSERVTVHQCAAGDAPGRAQLHVSPVLGESSLLDVAGATGAEEVEVRTVDSVIAPGQAIRLAKIDAEGFEPQVWKGMRRVVDENPGLVVIVEFGPAHLARAGLDVEGWLRQFTDLGFRAFEIDEVSGVVRPLRAVALLRQATSLNLLLLRRPATDFPELDFA